MKTKLAFAEEAAENYEEEFYAFYGFNRGILEYEIEKCGDDENEEYYEIEFFLDSESIKTFVV